MNMRMTLGQEKKPQLAAIMYFTQAAQVEAQGSSHTRQGDPTQNTASTPIAETRTSSGTHWKFDGHWGIAEWHGQTAQIGAIDFGQRRYGHNCHSNRVVCHGYICINMGIWITVDDSQ